MDVTVNKTQQVNVRLKPDLRDDLERLADFQGLTLSSYVHSILTRHVRQEREATPEAFVITTKPQRGVKAAEVRMAPVVARIEPGPKATTKDDVRKMITAEQERAKSGGVLFVLKRRETGKSVTILQPSLIQLRQDEG